MNFKRKWILNSFLIQSAVVGISIALFGSSAVGGTSDLPLEVFSFSILLFITPVISIALPQALLFPFTKRQKVGWFFSTSIGLWGGAVTSMLIGIGTSTGINILFFNYDYRIPFASYEYTVILLSILSAFLFLTSIGYILGTVQQKRLFQMGYAKFLEANSWRANMIKAITGSGVIFAGLIFSITFIPFSDIYKTTYYDRLLAAIIGISIYFSFLIPLTLLTAAPAAQLHEALNKHGIPIEATPLAD